MANPFTGIGCFPKNTFNATAFSKASLYLGRITLSAFVPKALQNPVTDESTDFCCGNQMGSCMKVWCKSLSDPFRSCAEKVNVALNTASVCDTVIDRKSTRLNSSHLGISYAVF